MVDKEPQERDEMYFGGYKEQPLNPDMRIVSDEYKPKVERSRGPQVAGAIVAWILFAIFLIALILLALDGFHYLYYGSFFVGR